MFTISCNSSKKDIAIAEGKTLESLQKENIEGLKLLQTHCYICHNPNAVSHDSLIAPPMAAVKMRYKMSYDNQEGFVNAISKWVLDPTEEKAIMLGAVANFKVMSKLLYKEKDVKKIATFIYENELEQPEWFEAHQKEMHGNGKGMGVGIGRANRMNQ